MMAGPADQPGAENDQRKRQPQQGNRDKGRDRDRDHRPVLQRATADPDAGLDDDGENSRLDAEEQPLDQRRLPIQHIERAETEHHQRAGQDEEQPCDQPAQRPVHQPADIDGKLLRLRPRQQHAVVERMQETLLADPAPLLDQLLVHQRDLAGRAAKAQQADLEPDTRRLRQARHLRMLRQRLAGSGMSCVGHALALSLRSLPRRGCQSVRLTNTLSIRRPSRSTTSKRQWPFSKNSPTLGRWFISARMKPATVW